MQQTGAKTARAVTGYVKKTVPPHTKSSSRDDNSFRPRELLVYGKIPFKLILLSSLWAGLVGGVVIGLNVWIIDNVLPKTFFEGEPDPCRRKFFIFSFVVHCIQSSFFLFAAIIGVLIFLCRVRTKRMYVIFGYTSYSVLVLSISVMFLLIPFVILGGTGPNASTYTHTEEVDQHARQEYEALHHRHDHMRREDHVDFESEESEESQLSRSYLVIVASVCDPIALFAATCLAFVCHSNNIFNMEMESSAEPAQLKTSDLPTRLPSGPEVTYLSTSNLGRHVEPGKEHGQFPQATTFPRVPEKPESVFSNSDRLTAREQFMVKRRLAERSARTSVDKLELSDFFGETDDETDEEESREPVREITTQLT